MLKSSLKTPEISQRKKVDVQGFQFPAMLPVPPVYVLWLGESDNLEALFPAWLMSCAQCWAFLHLPARLQIGFQSHSSDLPLIKEQDFQVMYLKLLPLAPRVVTGMAANDIPRVSPGGAAIRGAPARCWWMLRLILSA